MNYTELNWIDFFWIEPEWIELGQIIICHIINEKQICHVMRCAVK